MANNDKGMSPVAAGVVGAVVGAAVGATAVVLSEEKNREAIGKKFNEVKDDVGKMVEGAGEEMNKVASQGQGQAQAVVAGAEKQVAKAKKAVKSKL